jgi:hypothetical protein
MIFQSDISNTAVNATQAQENAMMKRRSIASLARKYFI